MFGPGRTRANSNISSSLLFFFFHATILGKKDNIFRRMISAYNWTCRGTLFCLTLGVALQIFGFKLTFGCFVLFLNIGLGQVIGLGSWDHISVFVFSKLLQVDLVWTCHRNQATKFMVYDEHWLSQFIKGPAKKLSLFCAAIMRAR